MKRLILVIATFLSFTGVGVLAFNTTAQAAFNPFGDACENVKNPEEKPATCKVDPTKDPISGKDQEGALIRITKLVSIAVGVASIIAIIIGGIQFVMSSGDPARVATAKNTVLFAVIGLAIAAIARFIVTYVISKL